MTLWNKIKQWYYSFRVDFEPGYEYKRIKSSFIGAIECMHVIMLMKGWERYTDVEAGVISCWVWYRRKK